jgi:retron-type reverse transcriptase
MDLDDQADEAWLFSVQCKLYQWSRTHPEDSYRDVWNWITDIRNLRCAWRKIALNKGRRTAGVDGITVGGIGVAMGMEMFVEQLHSVSWIVDADVRSFFDSMSHEWLVRFAEHRIGDPRMIRLIRKWLKAGGMDGAEWTSSDIGSPQGAVVSPTLANIYLHYTFDLWADRWRRNHARGNVVLVRYADDSAPRRREGGFMH